MQRAISIDCPFGYEMHVKGEEYAWWWAQAGGTPVEQSKADVRLSAA